MALREFVVIQRMNEKKKKTFVHISYQITIRLYGIVDFEKKKFSFFIRNKSI